MERKNRLSFASNYEPTWRDRVATSFLNALSPNARPGVAANRLVSGLVGSTGIGNNRFAVNDLLPTGIPFAAQELYRDPSSTASDYLIGAVGGPAAKLAKSGKAALARGRFELDYFGQPVTMLQNPSARESAGFISRTKYKAARRLKDPVTGETYLWDAADPALHGMVAEKLGIKKSDDLISDIIGID